MKAIGFAIVCLLLVFPAIAHADWQYTKWGMTKDQVTKAGGNQVTEVGDSDKKSTENNLALLQAPYAVGNFAFTAVFMFDRTSLGLNEVRLELTDPSQASSLHGILANKYGQPEKVDIPVVQLSKWRDQASNNNISLLRIGNQSATLIYAPIQSKTNKGL